MYTTFLYLHLHWLAVDEFTGRQDILKNDGSFFASVQDDVVHLAFNLLKKQAMTSLQEMADF